ncbi:MAG: hypothetical protein RLN62_02675 [Rickettsiales bacterium]
MKILKKLKLNRGHLIGTAALAATIVMPEMAIAETSTSTEISFPVYDRIISLLKGPGGQLMTLIAFVLSVFAIATRMSAIAMVAPFGVGIFIQIIPKFLDWLFPVAKAVS